MLFLLTRLSRGATERHGFTDNKGDFYSRASREARPAKRLQMLSCSSDFYSRASREARHETAKKTYDKFTFLLTRLSRGATVSKIQEALSFLISTHAPLARRDTDSIFVNIPAWISTHAPLARRDQNWIPVNEKLPDFYSRASREARLSALLYFPTN